MQESIGVGGEATVEVTRAFRIDWFSTSIVIIFILVIAYFLYKKGGKRMDWRKILKALIIGFVFALIAFIFSGDTSSIVVGLLVVYLELYFKEEKREKRRKK
jgi:RsiW-degrading membrane proteinase PrsW (M82 family)